MITLERVHARVHIEGEGLGDLELRLIQPGWPTAGPILDDGSSHAGESLWRASYAVPVEGDGHHEVRAHQPAEEWVLRVRNSGDATPTLRDFNMLPRGRFQHHPPGTRQTRPEVVRFPVGGATRALRRTTLAGVDEADLSCAPTLSPVGGSPERWFELQLPAANEATVRLVAGFWSAVELRTGSCAAAGPALACEAGEMVGQRYGAAPQLGPLSLQAGSYCLVVDGVVGDRGAGGPFELRVDLAQPPAPPLCAEPPCPRWLLASKWATEPEVVDCGGAACTLPAEICCVGFAGAACSASCGFGTLPVRCDGPEDCGAGEVCCESMNTGALCAAECVADQEQRCHTDEDCSGTSCTSCPMPMLGALDLCVDACP